MIVILAQGIPDIGFDSLARNRDHLHELHHALGGRRLGVYETEQSEAPSHDSKSGFLTTVPVWAALRAIVLPPIFDGLPEAFGYIVVARAPVCPHHSVHKAKTTGFPVEFDIAVVKISDSTPVFIGGNRSICERFDMPSRRKMRSEIGVRKIPQFPLF